MRVTNEKLNQLRNLKVILQQAYHDPACRNISTCPRQCGCRTRRQFELNTDTAICWEIADLFWKTNRSTTVSKADVKEISDKIAAYGEVTRHHSSDGWQKFFWNVKKAFDSIFQTTNWPDPSTDDWIRHLKNTIGRLKRYPKL